MTNALKLTKKEFTELLSKPSRTLTLKSFENCRPSTLGIPRAVSKVQSQKFALATLYNGDLVDSWLDFPKAGGATVEGDLLVLEYASGVKLVFEVS